MNVSTFVFAQVASFLRAVGLHGFKVDVEVDAGTADAGGRRRGWSKLVEHGLGQLTSAVGHEVGR